MIVFGLRTAMVSRAGAEYAAPLRQYEDPPPPGLVLFGLLIDRAGSSGARGPGFRRRGIRKGFRFLEVLLLTAVWCGLGRPIHLGSRVAYPLIKDSDKEDPLDLLSHLYYGFGVGVHAEEPLLLLPRRPARDADRGASGIGPCPRSRCCCDHLQCATVWPRTCWPDLLRCGVRRFATSILVNLPGETGVVDTSIDANRWPSGPRRPRWRSPPSVPSSPDGLHAIIAAFGPSLAEVALKFGSPSTFPSW
jgi:hypothetical protein